MVVIKRWYDEQIVVSEAIWAWEEFPLLLQVMLAKQLNSIIQTQRRQVRLDGRKGGSVSKLSSKRLLGLYKTNLKRRWHDKNPIIRRAVNALALIEEPELLMVADRIIALKAYLQVKALEDRDILENDLSHYLEELFLPIAYSRD